MRKTRNALIVAVVGAGAVLGTSSLAYADGASENTSSVEAGVSPNAQSATNAGPATLSVQTRTVDTDGVGNTTTNPNNQNGALAIPEQGPEQVFLQFDNDITLDPAGFGTCTNADFTPPATLASATTAQVVAACSDAIVGAGQAAALVPSPAPPPSPPVLNVELTVTTLNGATSVAGPTCQTPAGPNTGGPDGCGFTGGNPTLQLHAYNQALNQFVLIPAEIRPSTDTSADYGTELAVTNVSDTGGDAGALNLFNSTVGGQKLDPTQSTENGDPVVTKKKKKRHGKTIITITKTITNTITNGFDVSSYVMAKCQDDTAANGGFEYDFKGTFVYDDNSVDNDTNKQKCGNPAP
jgi:hypothetical protein